MNSLIWFQIFIFFPVFTGVLSYIIRIEVRITRLSQDICWIKKELETCRQLWENLSQ